MDFLQTFGMRVIDVIFILLFFYLIFSNLPMKRLGGAVKGIIVVAILWFIAQTFKLHMAEAVLGNITQYGFLLLIIMFPKEFQKLLENIGRRRIFSWNTKRLIEHDSRKELANAVINLARRKQGATIVIAREDSLDDEIISGEELGDVFITQNMIESLFNPRSATKDGAMIIRDDVIVSSGSRLTIARNAELEKTGAGKRHLSALGVVTENDCMAIVVSGDTGTISLFGTIDGVTNTDYGLLLREEDLHDGIDAPFIVNRIEDYLKGTDKSVTDKKVKATKRSKEKAQAQAKAQKGKPVKPKPKPRPKTRPNRND